MPLTLATYADVVVISLRDELTGDEVEPFLQQATAAADKDGIAMVIDCSGLRGMDSAGLEALTELNDRCAARMGVVKLCGLDETCSKILELTRLNRQFECLPDLESAVQSFT